MAVDGIPALQLEDNIAGHEDLQVEGQAGNIVAVETRLGISLGQTRSPVDCNSSLEDNQDRLCLVGEEDTAVEEDKNDGGLGPAGIVSVEAQGRGRARDCATSMPWLRLDVGSCVTQSQRAGKVQRP